MGLCLQISSLELLFSSKKQNGKEMIIEWHLLKDCKEDFIQGKTTLISTVTTGMEFCSRERVQAPLWAHMNKWSYSPGKVWISGDVKLLSGISGVRQRFGLTWPNRMPSEGRSGWSYMIWGSWGMRNRSEFKAKQNGGSAQVNTETRSSWKRAQKREKCLVNDRMFVRMAGALLSLIQTHTHTHTRQKMLENVQCPEEISVVANEVKYCYGAGGTERGTERNWTDGCES